MSKASLEATCRRSRPFVVALLYVTPHGIDPSEREIARWITLLGGLLEQACQAFRQRGVNRIFLRESFGRGAEKSQTGNQFQGIGPATHEIFDPDPPGKLFAYRGDDFFIART